MPDPASDKRTTVLLCDDATEILVLLEAEFGLHPDMQVVGEASNGKEAVDLARRHQPDVVVLDLAMPEMDGLEALPRILDVAPESRVVVLSAFEAGGVASRVLALGARRYVEKGTAATDIAGVVREVADGS